MKRFDDLQALVQTVLINQQTSLAKETSMSVELDALTAAVTKIEGQADSTIALVQGLGDFIRSHAADPIAIQQYADELSNKADALAAAVNANPLP